MTIKDISLEYLQSLERSLVNKGWTLIAPSLGAGISGVRCLYNVLDEGLGYWVRLHYDDTHMHFYYKKPGYEVSYYMKDNISFVTGEDQNAVACALANIRVDYQKRKAVYLYNQQKAS